MAARDAPLAAVEADLVTWFDKDPFADGVRRLGAYRGVTAMGALGLQAEVCDWRRFARAGVVHGLCRPGAHASTRAGELDHRGHITKAGNAHLRAQLVESAWSYQHRPYVGRRDRQAPRRAWPPRSWPGPGQPSCACAAGSVILAERKNTKSVVAAAIARELAGFLWAEMTA